MGSENLSEKRPASRVTTLLGIGLLVGLVYGSIEAVEAYTLSLIPGALTWRNGNAEMALVFMPLFYGLLYLLLSLPVVLLALLLRRIPWDLLWIVVLSGCSAYFAAELQGEIFSGYTSIIIGLGVAAVVFRWYRARRERGTRPLSRTIAWTFSVVMVLGLGFNGAIRLQEQWKLHHLPRPTQSSPNVLLLVMDTERADHLVPYGYQRPTSPAIAALAKDATLFESAYATSSWTLPSHASMFTGRYLHEHHAGELGQRYLDRSFPVLAEALRDRGYATGGFVANRYWTGRTSGLNRGFLHYEDYYGNIADAINRTVAGRLVYGELRPRLGIVDIPGRKRTDRINADLLDWLDGIQDHPFFAFCNYFDTHMPYLPPPSVAGMFGGTMDSLDEDEAVGIGGFDERNTVPSEAKLLQWISRYDESLAFMDRSIGALLDSLRVRGLLENTIVILASDHGENFGEKGLLHHGTSLYLTELRVPLLVRYPKQFPAGVRVQVPVSLADIPATVAGLTGIPRGVFPGPSLADAVKPGDSTRAILAEIALRPEKSKNAAFPAGRGWIHSLVSDRWQFILEESGRVELYDLKTDPAELQDVSSAAENQQLVSGFRARLTALIPVTTAHSRSRPKSAEADGQQP